MLIERVARRVRSLTLLVSSALPASAQTVTPLSAERLVAAVAPAPDHGLPAPAAAAVSGARRIAFPDGRTEVWLWTEGPGPAAEARYAVRLDGERRSPIRASARRVELVGARFDPLATEPDLARSPFPGGGNLCLVQYRTQPLPAYATTLARLGGDVLRYLGGDTHLVALAPARRDAVSALPFVRWVGAYHAELRVEPEVVLALRAGTLGRRRYSIQVAHRGPDDKALVAAAIARLGGRAEPPIPDGFLLEATLSPAELVAVARLDEVVWIDRAGELRTYVDKVRADGGADAVEAMHGLGGDGVRGEVLDVGVQLSHPDFQSPPLLVHGPMGGGAFHGTATTGIVFGDGTGSASARGLLPDGQGIVADAAFLANRYQHTAELLAPPFEALFQSNSWGTSASTAYINTSFQLDDIAFLFEDFVIAQAMGNFGSTTADGFAWAKNVVSVGGIRHFDTLTTADDAWSNAGSIGPAADGRIKPDLSYWYDSIRCTTAGGYTDTFGGTSAATPAVAGHFGLAYQMWHEERLGNAVGGATAFADRPKASTARALIVNSADPYPFSGSVADLARTRQGWGRPDVERLLGSAAGLFVVDESRALQNLETASYSLPVAAATPELRVTLVYKDLPGAPSATHHLVDDLSLRVTSPSGVVYWGNRGLLAGNASTPGGAANATDPIENVWIPAPAAGTWTVEVLADAIVADQHAETPQVDADFALVASGIEPVWRDLGHALAGAAGAPTLAGRGYLVAGTRYEVALSGAPAARSGIFVFGFTAASAPFLGGTLVPSLDLVVPIVTDASGAHELAQVVPPGIAAGTRWWTQAWVRDPTGPQGAVASNALELRFP